MNKRATHWVRETTRVREGDCKQVRERKDRLRGRYNAIRESLEKHRMRVLPVAVVVMLATRPSHCVSTKKRAYLGWYKLNKW